ncbi:MAG: zf-TFIIB domain-containing protein [Candidatus Thermoplasmatota archaeon]|nr:zf-TFIIB domain-containing protein [Candidatus Thermoplasmatota archaeon]
MVPEGDVSPDIDLGQPVKCPRCGMMMKQIVVMTSTTAVEVDHCIECEGYWFDKYELDKVIDEKMDGPFPFENTDANEADFPCPRCRGVTETKSIWDITVELCLDCSGLWLDGGELREVQERYRFDQNQNKLLELLRSVLDE